MPFNNIITLLYLFPQIQSKKRLLSHNPSVSIDFILFDDLSQYNINVISQRATLRDIKKHPNFPWSNNLCFNFNLTNNVKKQLPDIYNNILKPYRDTYKPNSYFWYDFNDALEDISSEISIDFYSLSASKNITFQHVLDYPRFAWNNEAISSNDNITMNIVEQNPQFPWNFNCLSYNKNLTYEFVKKHIHENWDWWFVCINAVVTYDNFVENSELTQYFANIIKNNKNSKSEILKIHKYLYTKFPQLYSKVIPSGFALRSDVIFEEIIETMVESEYKKTISKNPNLTWKIIYNNPQIEWIYFDLSLNPMVRQPAAITIQRAWRKHRAERNIASTAIQRFWRHYAYSPTGPMYKKTAHHFASVV